LFVAAPLSGPNAREELVASDVRSLLVNQLTEDGTSDQALPGPRKRSGSGTKR
jgi:hypothetical protein